MKETKEKKIKTKKRRKGDNRRYENEHKIRKEIAENREKVGIETEKKERKRIYERSAEKERRLEMGSEKKILKEIETKIENIRKIYTGRQDKGDTNYIGKKTDKKLTWKRKRNLKDKKI